MTRVKFYLFFFNLNIENTCNRDSNYYIMFTSFQITYDNNNSIMTPINNLDDYRALELT